MISAINTPSGLLDLVTPKTRTPTPKYPNPECGCGFSSGKGQGRPEDTLEFPCGTLRIVRTVLHKCFSVPKLALIFIGLNRSSRMDVQTLCRNTCDARQDQRSQLRRTVYVFFFCCSCTDSGLSHLTFDCTRHSLT